MKIGDQIRLKHGKESGRIVRIIDAQQVEIEIEDGFRIPILKSEIVVVASQESTLMDSEIDANTLTDLNWNGLYLAFVLFNDSIYELYLINDTSAQIHFVIGEEKSTKYKGIYSGVLEPGTYLKLHELSAVHFDSWPALVIQMLAFVFGECEFRKPIVKKLQFRSAAFFKNRGRAPVLNKDAIVYRLDVDALHIDPKIIEEGMQVSKKIENNNVDMPAKEIDLHIEKLIENFQGLSNSAILKIQLEVFQKNFDNALATGMEEIVFIHGVGNGVLKNEIHKVISNRKDIKFFKDAQKEKFGYGATLIRFK